MDKEALILKILLSSRDYVSGSKLAQILGVSKPTVSRLIKSLASKGFIVEVNPRLGYRLADLDDLSAVHRYSNILQTNMRFSIHYVEVCGSTQDIAETLAREGAPEGTVVIAEELKSGRGRMNRVWIAPRGGLWISIIFRPRAIEHLHLLSLGLGVAVAETLRGLLGLDARVKWPNDILIGEKKVAGILVEGKIEADRVHHIVAGIGLNVNNPLPPDLAGTATTIASVLGSRVPRIPILLNLLMKVDEVYLMLSRGEVEAVLSRWRSLSSTLGRYVKVLTVEGEVVGYAQDVDRSGSLIVVKPDGSFTKVYSGDVIHLRHTELG